MTYGGETWAMNKAIEEMIAVAQYKIMHHAWHFSSNP